MATTLRCLSVKDGNTLQPLPGVLVTVDGVPAGDTGPDGTVLFSAAYGAPFVLGVAYGDFRADLHFDEEYDLVQTDLEIDGPVLPDEGSNLPE